ncbi:MAG: anaerobic ribonucleoside-triphosphate reductase activating protein [Elusimicrobiota bacterium]
MKLLKTNTRIAGFNRISMIDWENRMSSVIFLSGCNWRCPYCHNRELCSVSGDIRQNEILEYLEEKSGWIDGVVLCGGEPLFSDDIIALAEEIKRLGYDVKLDTNGSYPARLKEMIDTGIIDYVAMDIKSKLTEDRYRKAVALPGQVDNVIRSMNILADSGKEFEFRTTMVPEIVSPDDIIYNVSFMRAGTKYAIQQYSNTNVCDEYFRNVRPYPEEILEKTVELINKKGVNACLRI